MKKLLIILSLLFIITSCSEDERPCDYRYEVWEQRDLPNCEPLPNRDCVFYVLISDEDVEGCHLDQGLQPLGYDRLYYRYVSNVYNPRR